MELSHYIQPVSDSAWFWVYIIIVILNKYELVYKLLIISLIIMSHSNFKTFVSFMKS